MTTPACPTCGSTDYSASWSVHDDGTWSMHVCDVTPDTYPVPNRAARRAQARRKK